MEGLILLFKWIGKIITTFFGLIVTIRAFLPGIFVGFFLLFHFIKDLIVTDYQTAFFNIGKTVFIAEQTIINNVNLALTHSPQYTYASFVAIVNSVLILYMLIKWIGKLLIGLTGSQAQWMAYIVAIGIVALIETVGMVLVSGKIEFIPIYDGLFFMIRNYSVLLAFSH